MARFKVKINIEKRIHHALEIGEGDLKSLFWFISERYKQIDIYAHCIDGTSLDTENIDEILSFENPNYRRIKSISIRAKNSFDETLNVDIKNDGISLLFASNVEISIKSENDAQALYISQELTKKFSEMKPWYNLLAVIPFPAIVLAIEFFLIILGTIIAIVTGDTQRLAIINALSLGTMITNINIFLCLFGNIFSIIFVFASMQLQEKIFPKIFFLIGKQKKSMEILKKWHSFIFIGIIFGIILGVIVNAISNWLLK